MVISATAVESGQKFLYSSERLSGLRVLESNISNRLTSRVSSAQYLTSFQPWCFVFSFRGRADDAGYCPKTKGFISAIAIFLFIAGALFPFEDLKANLSQQNQRPRSL